MNRPVLYISQLAKVRIESVADRHGVLYIKVTKSSQDKNWKLENCTPGFGNLVDTWHYDQYIAMHDCNANDIKSINIF